MEEPLYVGVLNHIDPVARGELRLYSGEAACAAAWTFLGQGRI